MDIVERLRDEASMYDADDVDLHHDAADTIERLRQQNAELVAEPSIKMLLAGKKALFRVVEDPTIDDARSVYEAMIAACKATGGE